MKKQSSSTKKVKTLKHSKTKKASSGSQEHIEAESPLTLQPKMRISRKDSGDFRERQKTISQPENSVIPSGRR